MIRQPCWFHLQQKLIRFFCESSTNMPAMTSRAHHLYQLLTLPSPQVSFWRLISSGVNIRKTMQSLKLWPNKCNIAIQYRSTLLNTACWTYLATILHYVASCCMDVEPSLISIKHLMQHHSIFLCSHVWPKKLHSLSRALQDCCINARAASPLSGKGDG